MRWNKVLSIIVACALSAGCELLVPFETVPESTTTTQGGGGTGGTTGGSVTGGATTGGGGTTTGGGATGGDVTTGGGGATTTSSPCDPTICPAPSGECKMAYCDAQDQCAEKPVDDGGDAASQVDGDCKKNICMGGTVVSANDDTDVLNDNQTCTTDACDAGTPKHDPVNLGTSCVEDNGKVCDSAGHCVECNGNADCSEVAKPICSPAHICVPPHCQDMQKNFDETDLDCGGNDCAKCANTLACGGPNDCQSGFCNNSVCSACNVDGQCVAASYCSSGVCVADKPKGSPCGTNGQCVTNSCVDGVCCGAAACGTCQSCNVPGNPGTCTNVPGGANDDTCSLATGKVCDGNGVCRSINGQPCAQGSICLSGNCADGVCCNSACTATCVACNIDPSVGTCTNVPSGQDDLNGALTCVGASSCDGNGACKKELGVACNSGIECVSNNCVDGACCSQAQCPTCQSCGVQGFEGSCQYLPVGQADNNPVGSCAGGSACDGAGGCKKALGQPCAGPFECVTGFCTDGVCCNSNLCGFCSSCDVIGVEGACSFVWAGDDPHNDCQGGGPQGQCNGAGACGQGSPGVHCSSNDGCMSYNCLNDVCQ